ncbi:phosphonate metabolism protein/1,5-bisphosphokinase (PRPP-forming) PhnN [Phytopseudomonas punonensis]|uniref:Ribose 1,5-bisphosphate phosphokinase PhnN n=1 Tax=Phytopseudomonas punonensis TaxID=1220495 RepID=A0A1M7CU04_9GAMM|nr:phosphonate metabolism protein/1,5-bisphosphokinase (PRPP-forming) PhnN [Pseudomonas punonensis]SHL70339.1 ribose 1,5-bisphosphokinase [Pseudomonas punonensis]
MQGRLIYLMGPSGSGKDSVLQAVTVRLEDRECRVARRVITRSAEAVGEDAVAVSREEFDVRLAAGAFAMHWRANGLDYAITREIDSWLSSGVQVIVNGSRGYLQEARRRYPSLVPVLLEVAPEILRSRLLSRARENIEQIEARLARSALFASEESLSAGEQIIRLDNSGSLDATVERLLDIININAHAPLD